MNFSRIVPFTVAGLWLAGRTLMAAEAGATTNNAVVARGNGIEIRRAELDDALAGVRSAFQRQNRTLSASQAAEFERGLLKQMIDTDLLLAQSSEADKAAGQKAADLRMTDLLEQAGSEQALEQALAKDGATVSQVRSNYTRAATAQATLERDLKITVSDDEVKNYYDAHAADYETPELSRISHILIFTVDPVTRAALPADEQLARRRLVENLLEAARGGQDFQKLAQRYSEDPGTRQDGGVLPPFPRGQMAPEIDAAAFSLTNNEISDIITTSSGYQIVKVLERMPAARTSYLVAAARIHDGLVQQRLQQEAPAYMQGLWKAANVEILDPDLKTPAPVGGITPPAGVPSGP